MQGPNVSFPNADGETQLIMRAPLDDISCSGKCILSAARATCTTMALKVNAILKRLDLPSTTVSVRHRRTQAEDCADRESSARKNDAFQLVLFLHRDLTIDQRQRLFCLASFSTTVLIFHCCAIESSVFVTQ